VSDEPADNSQVDLVGQIIDQKYKVLALLGRGGMGAVYLAHHLTLDKDVALKTFATTSLPDETKQRFKREARALGKLQHKNIVEVFDFGIASGGLPYYTMEHLDGESVAERIARKGPLDTNEAIYVFSELCHGLLFLS
jgi:serine/threonine protein kinase